MAYNSQDVRPYANRGIIMQEYNTGNPLFDKLLKDKNPTKKIPDELNNTKASSVGYLTMPRELTAKNGAKALLIGEFCQFVEVPHPDHCGCGQCRVCIDGDDAEPMMTVKVVIDWTTIKDIYKMAVEHLGR